MIEAVCVQLRTGKPLPLAAAIEGVTASDLSRWQQWGAAGQEPYATFCEEVARAQAVGLGALFDEVRLESKPGFEGCEVRDWKARVRLMESVSPEMFAPSTTVIVKAQHDASQAVIVVARRVLPPEHFAALMAALSEDDDAPADGAEVQH